MIKKTATNGYSLVEMIIYVAILSIISATVFSAILSFIGPYKVIQTDRMVDNSGINVMERMTREIRAAASVDSTNSDFLSNPGVLTIVNGASEPGSTIKFYTENGAIKMDKNGTYFGPLTLKNTNATALKFTLLDNGISKAIKIDLTIQNTTTQTTIIKNFHSTIILRGKL